MKKITLTISLAITLFLYSFAESDGYSKSNFASVEINQKNSSVNLTIDLLKKADIKMVLFNESGEEFKMLEEKLSNADHYQVEFSTVDLPQGEYICFIESENNIQSEFFEVDANHNLINTKIDNQTLHIYSTLQEPDYLITISSEDGQIHETIGMKGNVNCINEVIIDISDWRSGDYFILLQNSSLLSSFYFQIP